MAIQTEEARERKNARQREWQKNNLHVFRKNGKKWRDANREKENERCRLKAKRERERDPKAYNARLREWRAANYVSSLMSQTKSRAKKLGLVVNFDLEFLRSLLEKQTSCPYTKMPFNTPKPIGLRTNPWTASIDRIDSTKGYTTDNIEIVSHWWNLAKHEWPLEVIKIALKGLRS